MYVAIGNHHEAPFVRPPKATNVKKFAPAPTITVWIVAPSKYRSLYLADNEDNITLVVSKLASSSSMLVSPLSGGQWQWTKVKHEWQLVGHIRTSTAVSQKLLEVSGTPRYFHQAPAGPKGS